MSTIAECVQTSMAIYAFPCPPLPQMVLREESGQVDTISSHDLVTVGMQTHKRCTSKQLEDKMKMQMDVLQEYNQSIDLLYTEFLQTGHNASLVQRLYNLFQFYTRATLAIYMDKTPESVDARYGPADSVCKGDPVHCRTAEHLTLFRKIAGKHEIELESALNLSYEQLLLMYLKFYGEDGRAVEEIQNDEG